MLRSEMTIKQTIMEETIEISHDEFDQPETRPRQEPPYPLSILKRMTIADLASRSHFLFFGFEGHSF